MAGKNERISKWLDNEFDSSDPPRYRLRNNVLSNYYKYNDKNVKLNDNKKIEELIEFSKRIKSHNVDSDDKGYNKKMILESKLVQTYKDGDNIFHQFLNPKTPRHHANMLFNQMIDHCIINNYVDNDNNLLINKMLRNKFYEFSYDKSRKK